MSEKLPPTFLSDESAAIVENANGQGGFVLICEHAGQLIPTSQGSLGIDAETMSTHIGWDIGAAELSRALSKLLDAPLIMQRYSRLWFDCNRDIDAADAIVEVSDGTTIPANLNLSMEDCKLRYELAYQPFCEAITEVIDACVARGESPAIVTIHSFTPVFKGEVRELHLGVLHDTDSTLADGILGRTSKANESVVSFEIDAQRNKPYAAKDGVTHTLALHGVQRQLNNVMLEVRNDLITDEQGQKHWAQCLALLLNEALDS
jgi:predicted N-formylglutamate amidohydrolase